MSEDPRLTSDVSDFDFDRSAADSWRRFGERLSEVISVMDEDAALAIGVIEADADASAPYVTFRCGPSGRLELRADAAHLPPGGADVLAAAGWTAGAEPGDWSLTGTQEEPAGLAASAAAALRDGFGVQHPALLAPDQLADILTPTPVEPAAGPGAELALAQPVAAPTRRDLDAAVAAQLTALLGHEPLRDDDGDLALRVGTTMVFLRPSRDAQEVLVFAPLVHDIEGRSRAMEVISDLNTEARWVRFVLIRDRVYVSLSVFANPLVPVHLLRALQIVSLISDSIDGELAAKLRGRTTFTDGDGDADVPTPRA